MAHHSSPERPTARVPTGLVVPPPRRLPGTRATVGGLLVTVAAVGTFATATGRDQDRRQPVVIARHEVIEGATLTHDDVRVVDALAPVVGATFERIDDVVGRAAVGPIAAGDVLRPSVLTTDRPSGDREVLLRLPVEQVAVGRLRAGERVDVFSTTDDDTALVLADAEVLTVDAGDDDSLLAEREVSVVLSVHAPSDVAALVHAARTTQLTLVRSTGAAEPSRSGGTRAGTAAASRNGS